MRRSLSLAAAVLAALAVAPPASAAPTWLEVKALLPAPIRNIPIDAFFGRAALDVASDAAGNSIAVWIECSETAPANNSCIAGAGTAVTQAKWALRPAGGDWSAPKDLDTPVTNFSHMNQIELEMNAAGEAVVAWWALAPAQQIKFATRSAGADFGAPSTAAPSGSPYDPAVAINSAGAAVIAWDAVSGGNYKTQAIVRPAGADFGAIETIAEPLPSPVVYVPRVTIDPSGNVTAVWLNKDASGDLIETARRPAGGAFGAVQVLSTAPSTGAPYIRHDVDVDDQGRVSVVYEDDGAGGQHVILGNSRTTTGTFNVGAPDDVSNGQTATSGPRLTVDPDTNQAVAIWSRCPAGANTTPCRVETASRADNSSYQDPQQVSKPSSVGLGPIAAFAPDGAALALWAEPGDDPLDALIQGATRPPGLNQVFGAVTPVSTLGPTPGYKAKSPALSFDGQGNAIAIWSLQIPGSPVTHQLQARAYDAAPPTISAVATPDGRAGRPVTFSVSVADVWSATSVKWKFGDGREATGESVGYTYPSGGTFTVEITATDAVGNAATVTRSVQMLPADNDNDGADVSTDCNDANPNIRPGLPEVLGDQVDENCDGVAGQFPPKPVIERIISGISSRFNARGSRTTITRLRVNNVPAGATVEVRCKAKKKKSQKKDCPFTKKKVKIARGTADVLGAFPKRKRRLKAGTVIDVWITKPGAIGKVVRYPLRKGKIPTSQAYCTPVGKLVAQKTC